jgi:hypothetical protein
LVPVSINFPILRRAAFFLAAFFFIAFFRVAICISLVLAALAEQWLGHPRFASWQEEMAMPDIDKHARNKAKSGSPNTEGNAPLHQGGDQVRKAQKWGGGNKASKGPITKEDRQNENSSAKR